MSIGNHNIHYNETLYKEVTASTTDVSTGTVIPNGERVFVSRARCNGADPSAYVAVVWDWGGAAERVIVSTKGDVDLMLDSANSDVQFTGDGVKKFQIVIVNDNTSQTPIIGGSYEVTKLV